MYGKGDGAVWMDPRDKSDFDAGLLFFGALARMMPGVTWDDLQMRRMAGWWTDLKHAVGDVKDGVGDVLKDTFTTAAGATGDVVRLATDKKVADTVSRAATAYATNGASEGMGSALDALRTIFTGDGQATVQTAGAAYKQSYGFTWSNPWVIGGGLGFGALLIVLLARR